MVESKLTYEECRRQRLEENKRRMEELNLLSLSQSLKTPSPKRSPVKRRVPKSETASLPARRSSRFADKPAPNYKEDALEPLLTRRRSYKRRDLLNRVYASDEERMYAVERAEKVQSGLLSEYPSFVKPMLQSHVTGGFWLGLPVQFCKKHLPHHDVTITLVDEEENDFPTKYLADKTGLSGGWRGFSIDHELVDGDALVFHLVKPTTFKVYIIRAYESEDNDDKNNEANNNKDSDDTQLDRSAKRTRAKDKKANNNKDNKDSDDTQLDGSAKRTRANMKDNNNEDNKDTDDTRLDKTAKRTSTKDMKEKNNEDIDDTHLHRSAKRTRAKDMKHNKKDDKESDYTRLDRSAKRTRAKDMKDNKKDNKKESDDTH